MQQSETAAIALICDAQGVIQTLLIEQLSAGHPLAAGKSFVSGMAPGSIEKANRFLATLHEQGIATDWTMYVETTEQLLRLQFAGIAAAETWLILGAATNNEILRLAEALRPVNDGLFSALSSELIVSNQQQRATDHQLYEDLSQLNNELLTTQRKLAKANAELGRLNEERNRFLGMAAHDIRGALGVIRLYSELILDESAETLDKEHLEFLEIIQSSSDFVLQLVNDMLDLTKIEAGRLDLHLQPVDLGTLVAKNITLNRVLAGKKMIRLSFDHDPHLPAVRCDPARIEQILNNLISNAIKFSNPHTSVSIYLQNNGTDIILIIRDQGQGIPEADLKRLFTPFHKASVRSTGGETHTGLGLAIVHRIVMAHKGAVTVKSKVGRGTVFSVSLPVARS